MSWIESHDTLRDHPKRKRLSRRLGISSYETIGLLQCLWWWCMSYAPDGSLIEYTADDVADGIDWPGDPVELVSALQDAGFLDGMSVHDWDQYGEKLFRRRQANAERMRTAREQAKPGRAQHVHSTLDTHAEREDRTGQDRDRTEEEKHLSSPSGPDQSDFDAFWEVYPRKEGKGKARQAYTVARRMADAAEIVAGVERHLPKWSHTESRFIPMPATWLHQERWTDSPNGNGAAAMTANTARALDLVAKYAGGDNDQG